MRNITFYIFIAIAWQCFTFAKSADLPCSARDLGIAGRSVVCVCNATYCDTITRDEPAGASFVSYTSSRAGKRFEKGGGRIKLNILKSEDNEDNIERDTQESMEKQPKNQRSAAYTLVFGTQFQTIEGFGGSVTDAASINWQKLSESTQTHFIDSYFSKTGLEYNLIRVPIGGADFSTHPYTYNEYPINDFKLSNFTLTEQDFTLKLPMIKRGQAVSTSDIKITASTWSPPVWMKTNNAITGFAQLKPEFYQSYADYHLREDGWKLSNTWDPLMNNVKSHVCDRTVRPREEVSSVFIEEYEKENVKIWALTTTNEPINGIVPFVKFNSLGWFPGDLGRWVANNLGPTIRNSRFNDTLILAVDDQRYLLDLYLRGMERADPKSIEYMDGVAVHYYGNFFPADSLTRIHNKYPNKIILATEACEETFQKSNFEWYYPTQSVQLSSGPMPWDVMRVKVGSWERAARYARHIIDDLNNFVVGWLDWNLGLDENGGPNWVHNYVDAPILIYGDKDEFIKQPMFYAMGHFSKFIPRGSRRIQVFRTSLDHVDNVAFITPQGNIVMVLHNTNTYEMRVRITTAFRRYIDVTLDPESIKTIEIKPY